MPVIPCATTPPVLGIVTFSASEFITAYPEFTGISPTLLAQAFALAQTVLNNTCSSRVQDANQRETLLMLLTAHITFLLYGSNDGGSTFPLFSGIGTTNGTSLIVTGVVSGALTVGAFITDFAGVFAPGTVVTGLDGGTGGVGVYFISPSQTIAAASPFYVPGAALITPAPGIVGRINTATEGSVSVAAEFGGDGGPTQDWYTSTKYGAMYWLATSQYRTALYIPAPGGCPGWPGYGGFSGPNGGGCGC